MSESPERYKKPPSRGKKTAPVKRIILSPEAAAAYEKEAQKRAERDRDYGRHLAADNKSR